MAAAVTEDTQPRPEDDQDQDSHSLGADPPAYSEKHNEEASSPYLEKPPVDASNSTARAVTDVDDADEADSDNPEPRPLSVKKKLPSSKMPSSTGDFHLSFGRDDIYCMQVPPERIAMRSFKDGPSLKLMNSGELGYLYMHAFSPHDDEFICYLDANTKAVAWTFYQAGKLINYQSLRSWLTRNLYVQDKKSLYKSRVCFGSGASYFASNGEKCTHHDLPEKLSDMIDSKMTKNMLPDIISLGAAGTYFARWPDGTSIWALQEDSKLLKNVSNEDSDKNALAYVFLHPTQTTRYVAVYKSGMCVFHLPEANGMCARHIKAYIQLKAKETGATFSMEESLTGTGGSKTSSKVSYIGPDTEYQMPDLDEVNNNKKTKKEKEKAKKETLEKEGLSPSPSVRRRSIFGLFPKKS